MLKPVRRSLLAHKESALSSPAHHARIEAGKPGRALTLRRSIEPDAADRARRIADTASARLWLADGIPFADAITMLEIRRRFELSPDYCRAHAIEAVWTAWRAISARKGIGIKEESHHAIA